MYRRPTTEPIPFDVDPGDLKARLQHLYPIGIVTVTASAPSVCGARTWSITFVSDENYAPPKQTLVLNPNLLTGAGASVGAGRTAGTPPQDYARQVVNATSTPSFVVRSLTPGGCLGLPVWCCLALCFCRPVGAGGSWCYYLALCH